jgi:uncharacterized protein involved in exopolysaccharide biosynthesis
MTQTQASVLAQRPDDYVSLVDFSRALAADWRLVGSTILIAAVLSVAVAFLLTPKYTAETVIIEKADRSGSGGSAAMLARLGGLAQFAGIDLSALGAGPDDAKVTLYSRALLERFITTKNLLPVLFADDWDDTARRWTTSPEDTPTVWLGVKFFGEHVYSVKEDLTTGVIAVRVEWTDPEIAASWANDLVKLANEIIRTRALNESQRNIDYLNQELARTDVVGLQQVLYGLLESEMKVVMLANDREEYAFTVIDPATVPELRSFPNRPLVAVAGTIFGGFIAMLIVLIRLVIRRQQVRERAVGS